MNPGCIGEKESIPKLLPLDKADFFFLGGGRGWGGGSVCCLSILDSRVKLWIPKIWTGEQTLRDGQS